MNELLAGICNHPDDFGRWGILSDWFADQGDDVAEDWARWVGAKQRYPDDYKDGTYRWWVATDRDQSPTIPHYLWVSINDSGYRGLIGEKSPALSYVILLEGWRLLTSEQRQKCWAWSPNEEAK